MSTTEDLLRRYQAVTAPALYRYADLTFVRGEGVFLYDPEGRRYVDFVSGIATMATGHAHPRVVEAVIAQARLLMHVSIHIGITEPYVRLLEKLRSIAPPSLRSGKGILVNSGGEAVEAAVKLARYATGRPLVIAFQHAFHGRPMGALSLTASNSSYRKRLSALLPGVHHAVFPSPHLPLGATPEERGRTALALLEDLLRTVVPPEDVAAVVVEPVLGEGGYLVPPPGFLEGVWTLARRYGILTIVDEVQTGIGRTGKWFAIEHWGLDPDILVMGKALGGGMPLGAILARAEIADAWEPGAHGSTFGGHPVSCQAGLAAIEVIESEGLLDHARVMGEFVMRMFESARARVPMIGEVRGMGLMIGVDVVDPETRRPVPSRMKSLLRDAAASGVVLTKCGESTIRIAPPLIITREQVASGVETLLGVLREAGAPTPV